MAKLSYFEGLCGSHVGNKHVEMMQTHGQRSSPRPSSSGTVREPWVNEHPGAIEAAALKSGYSSGQVKRAALDLTETHLSITAFLHQPEQPDSSRAFLHH